jgi:hypothetical protein
MAVFSNIALKETASRGGGSTRRSSQTGLFQAYLDGGRLAEIWQPTEAVVLLKEAVHLKPSQGLPRYYLALAYLTSWNRAGAWEQYFALRDISPELAANLAKTLER